MVLYNFPFLNKTDVDSVKIAVAKRSFVDGRNSARGSAKDRKSNVQLELNLGATQTLYTSLLKLIFDSEIIKNLVYPKHIPRVFVNRYSKGSYYGWHVDNTMINRERTDFSFTIWLSDPGEYEGGELQIKSDNGPIRSFKCNSGHILLYPTGERHQVTEVTSGERQAIVGWITSAVASDADRAILYNYQKVNSALLAGSDPEEAEQLLNQVYQKLIRRFSS